MSMYRGKRTAYAAFSDRGIQPWKKYRYQGKYQTERARAAQKRKEALAARMLANVRTGGYVGIEKKFLDTEMTGTALTTAWANYAPTAGCTGSISVPTVGTGESERLGRKYTIKSVHLRGLISTSVLESQAAPVPNIYIRIIMYWDRQTNSAAPAVTDIMDTSLTNDIVCFRNLQNSSRFIVLMDKVIIVRPMPVNEGAVNVFATPGAIAKFTFNKKITIDVTCDGTTADVASVSDHNLGIQAIASTTTGTPSLLYQARVRFCG